MLWSQTVLVCGKVRRGLKKVNPDWGGGTFQAGGDLKKEGDFQVGKEKRIFFPFLPL